MKPVLVLLAVVVLGVQAGAAAEEEKHEKAPAAVVVEPLKLEPVPAAPVTSSCAAPCVRCHCHGGHLGRVWAWLTYRPAPGPGLCGCLKRCAPRDPPLYTFFLDRCAAGACGGCTPGPHAVPPDSVLHFEKLPEQP